jgi:4-hydroxy-2-oxoheptanedioate aldolase
MDLSASLGYPGETNHPEVRSSVDAVVDAVLRRRDVRLLTLAQDENEASEWINRGASLVLVSAPALVAKRLAGFASSFGERLGDLVATPKDLSQ